MIPVLLGALLGSSAAEAKEYLLDPRASSVSLDDLIVLVPQWIDATRQDYVILLDVRNDSQAPVVIPQGTIRCIRGEYEGAATYGASFGVGERSIDLAAGQVKSVKLLCNHGALATGDFALKFGGVYQNPMGDGRTLGPSLFENVEWRMSEADITRKRQALGEPLAIGTFDRPNGAPDYY
jgi:hypothetical protein